MSLEFGVRSEEFGVWSEECRMRSVGVQECRSADNSNANNLSTRQLKQTTCQLINLPTRQLNQTTRQLVN
mgnify:CR=1 FL=1